MDKLNKQDYQNLSDFRYRLRIFQRHSENICKAHGLTSLQYLLLLHLKGFSGREWATISELSEKLQAKHHGTVMLVDRCCELGLVERRESITDKRCIEIHLLPAGDELAGRIAWLHRPELELLEQKFPLSSHTDEHHPAEFSAPEKRKSGT
jgi:DNA-binding MarR family transcriptional regulator